MGFYKTITFHHGAKTYVFYKTEFKYLYFEPSSYITLRIIITYLHYVVCWSFYAALCIYGRQLFHHIGVPGYSPEIEPTTLKLLL